MEDWKIKVSLLWLFNVVGSLSYMILGVFEPGAMRQFLLTGEAGGMKMGPEILLIGAIKVVSVTPSLEAASDHKGIYLSEEE